MMSVSNSSKNIIKKVFVGGNHLHSINGPATTSSLQDEQQHYQQRAACELKKKA